MSRVNLSPFPHSLSISSFSFYVLILCSFPHSLSISSFSLHFLFIFSFSLHFLTARLAQVVQPWIEIKQKCLKCKYWAISGSVDLPSYDIQKALNLKRALERQAEAEASHYLDSPWIYEIERKESRGLFCLNHEISRQFWISSICPQTISIEFTQGKRKSFSPKKLKQQH